MKVNIVFLILFCVCFVANGQDDSEKRIHKKIKLNVLEKVIQYQINSVIESDQIDDFIKLFKNNQIEILNDIIPDNSLDKKISVEDYIDRVPTYFKDSRTIIVTPYEVKINNYDNITGNGIATVNCFKIISGKEKSGPYFLDTLDIGIVFEFNFISNEYSIVDITLNQEPYFYLIIKSYEKSIIGNRIISNDTMIINGRYYVTDKNGDIILKYSNNITKNFVIYPKSDQIIGIDLIQIEDLKKAQNQNSRTHKVNLFKLFFRQSMISINPYFNYVGIGSSPINSSKVNTNNDFSFESGLNFLFTIYKGRNGAWFMKSGVGFASYSYNIENPELIYTYNDIDPDNSGYRRTCHITDINETNKVSYLIVPILIERTNNLSQNYHLYLNLGATYFKVQNSSYNSSAIGNYYGQYPDLFDITISQNGVYDFGSYGLYGSGSIPFKSNFWALQLGIGLNKNLSKRIGLRTGLTFKKGLNEINQDNNKPISRSYSELNSLTSISVPLKVNFLSVDLGLIYKL